MGGERGRKCGVEVVAVGAGETPDLALHSGNASCLLSNVVKWDIPCTSGLCGCAVNKLVKSLSHNVLIGNKKYFTLTSDIFCPLPTW